MLYLVTSVLNIRTEGVHFPYIIENIVSGNEITLYFECLDLDDQVKVLQAKGVSFELLPTDQPWLWRKAHLRDPSGHRIILYFAGINRKNPPWRIGG